MPRKRLWLARNIGLSVGRIYIYHQPKKPERSDEGGYYPVSDGFVEALDQVAAKALIGRSLKIGECVEIKITEVGGEQ